MRATRQTLREDLERLGVRSGDLLMVHSSLRRVGPIAGGVNTLIHALFDAIGPRGTLTAYVDFESFLEDDELEDEVNESHVPVFDKRTAHAARDHGVLHETLRNWPGALRSDHPDAGVIAIGPLAETIVSPHPFQYGYGPGTPFERILQGGGRILMIGAPLDTITLLHYAEHMAQIPDKHVVRYRRLMPSVDGPQWITFEEYDTADPVHSSLPENCFERIALDFIAARGAAHGPIGQAPSYLFEAAELVRFGTGWIEAAVRDHVG
ncbi:MAG: aminoglycoside 3-N-acetyltransferase [Acidobacteria bacterium]|nr:aminoglycoside 3-N-acetyltransferase [Acidobacteriota bacterium]